MGNNSGDAPVPVVSYARISADTSRDAHGVRDQHKVNRATADRLGWVVAAEITDNDRSASKAGVVRDGFELMLRAVAAGHLDDGRQVRGVLVVADDRLARRPGDYERFVDALTAEEGRVYADARGAKDLYSEDVEGMGLVGVAFAKIEARKIKRRMRRSHRARAEAGIPVGGTRPFGWQDDKITLHPVEGPALARAAEEFAAGRSLNSIVQEWQRRGLRTSRGNAWTTTSLKVSLNNPRLCGWRRLNGEIVSDATGAPIVGAWESIVTCDVWLALKAVLDNRSGRIVHADGSAGEPLPVDYHRQRYLLTGVLRCGKPRPDGSLCGTRLRVSRQRDCVQHIYMCPARSQGGCGGIGRRGDKVDEFIVEAVLAKLEQRQLAAQDATPWPGHAELSRLNAKMETLRQQWQSDQVSDGFFFTTVRGLEERTRELQNERGRHELAAKRASADVHDIRRRWEDGSLDISQKRTYLREALHAVVVHPAGRGCGSRGQFNPDLLELVWRD